MEKKQERDRDSSSKKEHATKLITPQVAKLEHTYRPGERGRPYPLQAGGGLLPSWGLLQDSW